MGLDVFVHFWAAFLRLEHMACTCTCPQYRYTYVMRDAY